MLSKEKGARGVRRLCVLELRERDLEEGSALERATDIEDAGSYGSPRKVPANLPERVLHLRLVRDIRAVPNRPPATLLD